MSFRGLSDAEIEALIDGEPVAAAPAQLSELVGALRSEFDAAPTVEIGTALGEFIDVVDVTTAAVGSSASEGVGLAAKAFAAFGAVSVKVLVGAAVAAASVGGAHAFGVVDVPGLPDLNPSAPVEVPEPVPDPGVEVPVPVDADESRPSERSGLPGNSSDPQRAVVEPGVPGQGGVEAGDGCEFGQQTATTRSGEAAEQRGDAGVTVDPCDLDEAPGQTRSDRAEDVPQGRPEGVEPGTLENAPQGRTPRGG